MIWLVLVGMMAGGGRVERPVDPRKSERGGKLLSREHNTAVQHLREEFSMGPVLGAELATRAVIQEFERTPSFTRLLALPEDLPAPQLPAPSYRRDWRERMPPVERVGLPRPPFELPGARVLYVGGAPFEPEGGTDGAASRWIQLKAFEHSIPPGTFDTIVVREPEDYRRVMALRARHPKLRNAVVLLGDRRFLGRPAIDLDAPLGDLKIVSALPSSEYDYQSVFGRASTYGELSLLHRDVDMISALRGPRIEVGLATDARAVRETLATAKESDVVAVAGHVEWGMLHLLNGEVMRLDEMTSQAHLLLLGCSTLEETLGTRPPKNTIEVHTVDTATPTWSRQLYETLVKEFRANPNVSLRHLIRSIQAREGAPLENPRSATPKVEGTPNSEPTTPAVEIRTVIQIVRSEVTCDGGRRLTLRADAIPHSDWRA